MARERAAEAAGVASPASGVGEIGQEVDVHGIDFGPSRATEKRPVPSAQEEFAAARECPRFGAHRPTPAGGAVAGAAAYGAGRLAMPGRPPARTAPKEAVDSRYLSGTRKILPPPR